MLSGGGEISNAYRALFMSQLFDLANCKQIYNTFNTKSAATLIEANTFFYRAPLGHAVNFCAISVAQRIIWGLLY